VSNSDVLAQELPKLRRYARALAGNQPLATPMLPLLWRLSSRIRRRSIGEFGPGRPLQGLHHDLELNWRQHPA